MSPVRKTKALEKHDAIMGAALELFVSFGFHGTAVPQVAEKAGVGAGTIYRYFKSKEALVNALYQKLKADLAGFVLSGFSADVPAREQFHGFWLKMSHYAMGNPAAFAFLELHHHRDYLDATSLRAESKLVEFATLLLLKMQKDKIVKAIPPMILMAFIWGAFVGVVRQGWEGRLELSDDTFAAAEQCAWEAIRF
jgi:AcrR family transcriptional regulator